MLWCDADWWGVPCASDVGAQLAQHTCHSLRALGWAVKAGVQGYQAIGVALSADLKCVWKSGQMVHKTANSQQARIGY